MTKNFQKILVINLRNLGDVLLMTPLLDALKARYPVAVLDVMVYQEAIEMLEMGITVRKKYAVPRQAPRLEKIVSDLGLARQIRSEDYSLVISLTEGDRSAIFSWVSGAKYRIGIQHSSINSSLWKKKAYSHLYPTQPDKKHRVEQYLDVLRSMGERIPFSSIPLRFQIAEEATRSISNKLRDFGVDKQKLVVVHPGSRWTFKTLSDEQLVEVIKFIKRCGYDVVVTGDSSRQEQEKIDRIKKKCGFDVIDLSAKISVSELAALLKASKILISSDSMPMHLAAAVGTKVIAWFGPSNQTVWHPWFVEHRILAMDYPCRPCGLDGCGRGKISECLYSIPVADFEAAIRQLDGI